MRYQFLNHISREFWIPLVCLLTSLTVVESIHAKPIGATKNRALCVISQEALTVFVYPDTLTKAPTAGLTSFKVQGRSKQKYFFKFHKESYSIADSSKSPLKLRTPELQLKYRSVNDTATH